MALGLPPEMAFAALLASLIGSYINIPVARVVSGNLHPATVVHSFGVRYQVPIAAEPGSTIVAVNVGGAIVPVLIAMYLLVHWPGIWVPAIIGTAIVTLGVHRFPRPIPGLGIATPILIPPL